jgi:hypothetical protein
MQKLVITLLGLATFVLAVVCAAQWRQLNRTQARLQAAEEAQRTEAVMRETQTSKLTELERANERLDQQVREFTSVTTTLRTKDATQSSNITALATQLRAVSPADAGAENKPGFGQEMGAMVQKMMKDPAMREMMRSQQQSAVKMMYSGLLKQLNLTPEEKDKFMGILTDLQMKTVENAQGLFSNEPDAPDAKEKNLAIGELKKQADADIKQLLGDERNEQFKDYQANLGERMQIDQLQARLTEANLPLQEQQSAQLLEAMKVEKTAVPPPIPTDANENPANLKNLMTSENIDKQIQWMTDYNQRVLDRAAGFLTPEQLKSYREMQEQQAAMQQMGLKMAKEMFGSGKGGGGAPAK